MGMCLCRHIFDDNSKLERKAKLHQDMSVVKNRIQGRRLPVIWMDGPDESGVHSHGCNIAERFGYAHVNVSHQPHADDKHFDNATVMSYIKKRMVEAGDTKGYLLTGFPRNSRQVRRFFREVGPVDCIIQLQGEVASETQRAGDVLPGALPYVYDKYNITIEKINASEPASDVFLKIEATILDRLASNSL